MELVILIGLPGAGKSTFYRERFAATHRHISKDEMPRSAPKERRQREQVMQAFREGTSLAPVWELPGRLGPASFARVVEALAMYRGEAAWVASDVAPLAAA